MSYRDTYNRSSSRKQKQQRKQPKEKSYKSPDPATTNKYKSMGDLSKKYNFDLDYSRDYADSQADSKFQGQKDNIESEREEIEQGTEQSQKNIKHDYFNKFREQNQSLSDRGINAGLSSEYNFQLERERQNEVSDVLTEEQKKQQDLDRELGDISRKESMYADELYDERLQQKFDNTMDYKKFQQQENQFQLDMEMRQRNELSNQKWREYKFNNMSAAEKAKLEQSKQQFGEEMAWKQYEFNNMSKAQKEKLAADTKKHGFEMAWRKHQLEAGMNSSAGGAGNFSQYKQTSQFGTRTDPIDGSTKHHNGNDYATPTGTPISSTVGGKVIRSGNSGSGWGNYVVVQDVQGNAHIYAHLSNPQAREGSTVQPGQIVGASGNSGRSTGAHLHYEVRKNGLGGTPIDPNQWI